MPRQARSGQFLPSARSVTLAVHRDGKTTHRHMNVMAAVFGEFIYHDLSHTPQMAGQSAVNQGRAGQDRTGQDRAGRDRPGQDRAGQDRPGQVRSDHTSYRHDLQVNSGLQKNMFFSTDNALHLSRILCEYLKFVNTKHTTHEPFLLWLTSRQYQLK